MYLCRATFFGLLELSTNMESSSLFRKTKDLNGLHKAEGYNFLCGITMVYGAASEKVKNVHRAIVVKPKKSITV